MTLGLTGAAISSALLYKGAELYTVLACLLFCGALTYFSAPQKLFAKLLNGFAESPVWPRFVALGIAQLVAAYKGGIAGIILTVFLLAAFDGNTFTTLY